MHRSLNRKLGNIEARVPGLNEAYGRNKIELRIKISRIPAKEIFATPKYDLQQGFKPKYRFFSPGNGLPGDYIDFPEIYNVPSARLN